MNAICSHEGTTNAVVCRCKVGYTNTGSAPNVTCTGTMTICVTVYHHMPLCLSNSHIDTCFVNNGGCDANAICSHETTNNAVKCTCKTGYVFTGTGSNTTCTGNLYPLKHNTEDSCIYPCYHSFSDACQVSNGGCDPNANCSHEKNTNAVVCTCKTGYTDTLSGAGASCTGIDNHLLFISSIAPPIHVVSLQTAAE